MKYEDYLKTLSKPEKERVEKIVAFIKKHPEGITIQDIAKNIDLTRMTITKYVFGLHGASLINMRRVGKAWLITWKNL